MRKFKLAGACFALLSVLLGAFASHFLKSYLDIQKFDAFETGIRYIIFRSCDPIWWDFIDFSLDNFDFENSEN